MLIQCALLLLPVAATCGWHYGRLDHTKNPSGAMFRLRRDYFKGLNYLIDEQPDKAVDVFIKLLEVDSETVETHLALGNLFRRRGEVDKAIRIHQNVMARPQLDRTFRMQALAELGQDYLSAGVFDRAERLFLELIKYGYEDQRSLSFLLNIYQKEGDWRKAIQIAKRIERESQRPMHLTIAHYYCELSLLEKDKGFYSQAKKYLKQALAFDSTCVRARIVWAELEVSQLNYTDAIYQYKQVQEHDADYVFEILAPLSVCFQQCDQVSSFMLYLKGLMHKDCHVASLVEIAKYMEQFESAEQAIPYVEQSLQRSPSLLGLKSLIDLRTSTAKGEVLEQMQRVGDYIDQLLSERSAYQCCQCGFESKALYWLCPGCQLWSTIKPKRKFD